MLSTSFSLSLLKLHSVCRRNKIDLCGKNSGQHVYLDVAQAREPIELDVVSEDRSLPISWHLRITQVG